MKYSTLSFIISSSILLHACGSSNNNQNHTTDPNQNTQHQSNSHNINGNQSSNNSNQAANSSQNSNHSPKTNNQNDFTPNISSGNAPNPKNNIIISANNHQNDDDDDNDIDMNIDLDQLTLEQANALVNAADKEFNDANIAMSVAETEKGSVIAGLEAIQDSLKGVAETIRDSEDKTRLPALQQQLEDLQKLYEKKAAELNATIVKAGKEEAKKNLAMHKQELADNAKKYVEEKPIDPEAVLNVTTAKHKKYQEQIKQDTFNMKKTKLNEEAKGIEKQIEALKKLESEIEKITTAGKTEEAKNDATNRIAKIKEDIAKLEKAKTEKIEEANNLDIPIKQAKVVIDSEQKKVDAAVKAAAYRGVYASDGKYDPSTSYKNVKKVVAANPSLDKKTNKATPDKWMQEWTLFIKDGDKEVKIDTSELGGELKLGKKINPVARFDVSKDILASQAGVYFVQGRIGNNFFNAGLVTPEDKIPVNVVEYKNTSISANKAFLKTSSNLEVIADVVEAKADFGKKTFEGKFSGFKEYTIKTTDGHIGSGNGGITDTEIKFKADIKGNKFVPVTNPEKNAANVYGYFYGDGATEAGGLVEHDKFYGTFGVRAKD